MRWAGGSEAGTGTVCVVTTHNAFRGDKMNFDNLTLPFQHATVNKEKRERKIFLLHSVSFYRPLPRVKDLSTISCPSLEKTLLFLLLLL